MTTTAQSITIAAPVDRVWAVLADFDRISAWAPDVEHSCIIGGERGPGTTRRVQVGPLALLETVTTWEPERSLAYTITGLPPVVRSTGNRWDLEPVGERTRVTLTTEVDCGSRPPQRLVARLIARRMGKASAAMLDGLADYITVTPTTPSENAP